MTYLLLQTFLLLLSSYFLGAFLACLIKRTLNATRALPAAVAARPAADVRPVPAPVRAAAPAPAPLKPRTYEPIQPKIDILPRPEPRPAPAALDTARFDRAFDGAQLPDTTPRKMIMEIRPQCLKAVTQRGGARDTSLDKPKPAPQPAAPQAKAPPAPAPTAPPAPAQPAAKAPAAPQTSTPVVAKPQPPAPAPQVAAQQPAPAQPAPAQPAPTQAAQAAAAAAAAALAAGKAAAAPSPQPVPAAPSAPALAAPAARLTGDDFLRIRAVDEAIAQKLYSIGIKSFEDMARWTPADINRINQVRGLQGPIALEQ